MSDLLKEARELCEAATPGPWICGVTDGVVTDDPRNYLICTHCTDDDKKFIARARTLVPELVELCEEQQQAYYRAYKDYSEDIARWKARAEALESAIKRKHRIKCEFCLQNKPKDTYQAYECDSWQFDYDRFKEDEHERVN